MVTTTTTTEAIRRIETARTPADLFEGNPAEQGDARRGRRLYRSLIAVIHPDLVRTNGIDASTAQRATARLNELYARWCDPGSGSAGQASPHIVGRRQVYTLRVRTGRTALISTYATDEPGVFVDISRTSVPAAHDVVGVARRLATVDLAAFVPRIADHGTTSARAWVAYRIPAGMCTLRQVRSAYPRGLDGRDWAWMARRILITLDVADTPHPGLSLDNVLIHPAEHGVVVTGWGADPTVVGRDGDAAGVRDLFHAMLAASETRHLAFAEAAAELGPAGMLREYDLFLRVHYGPRRFRPFAMPAA